MIHQTPFIANIQALANVSSRLIQSNPNITPNQISFDMDAVMIRYAIPNEQKYKDFYKGAHLRQKPEGHVPHHILPIPGMVELVKGLGTPYSRPIIVSSMTRSRGFAILNHYPDLAKAFLGPRVSTPLSLEAFNRSLQIYFAEDLVRGMLNILEIQEKGLVDEKVPKVWQGEFSQTVHAIRQGAHKDLLKSPLVIAYSRNGVKPKIHIDDSDTVAKGIKASGSDVTLIQPKPPWTTFASFFDNPQKTLEDHTDDQAKLVALSLIAALKGDYQDEHVVIPREVVRPLAFDQFSLNHFLYIEDADSVHNEYFKWLYAINDRRNP